MKPTRVRRNEERVAVRFLGGSQVYYCESVEEAKRIEKQFAMWRDIE